MMVARNLVRGFVSTLAQLFSVSLIFIIIANTPSISVEQFGKVLFAFTSAQLFSMMSDFGLSQYTSKTSAQLLTERMGFERSIFGFQLFLAGIGIIFYWLYIELIVDDQFTKLVCFYVGASVFLSTSTKFIFCFYQGRERLDFEVRGVIVDLLVVFSCVFAAYLYSLSVLGVSILLFFARLVSWITNIFLMSTFIGFRTPKIDIFSWKRYFVESSPFGMTFFIALSITSIDTILLRQLSIESPEYQVGLYQAALKIAIIPTVFSLVVTKVFLPAMSRIDMSDRAVFFSNLKQLNNFLQVFGVLSGAWIYFNAEDIVLLILPDEYLESVNLVRVLAIVVALRFGTAYNLYFAIRGHMWLRVAFGFFALAILVLFNFMFIGRYGALGAAYASVITHVLYYVPFFVAMKIYEGEALFGLRWFRLILIFVTFLFIQKIISDHNLYLNIAVSGLYILLSLYFSLSRENRIYVLRKFCATFMKSRY